MRHPATIPPVKARLARVLAVALAVLALGACSVGNGPAASPAGGTSVSAGDALAKALAAHTAGRIDDAVRGYFQVLSLDPTNKFAFYNLGEIAQRQNKLATAEGYYRSALEADANMSAALFNLAIVLTQRGDTTEAIALYRRVIAIDAKSAGAHYNLGLLLRQIGQTAEADRELATAHQLDPKLIAPSASPRPQASASPTGR